MEKALTLQIDDVDIFAQQQGDRIESIFIHGFGDDLSTWDRLWEVMDKRHGALRYDLREFGQSTAHSDLPFSHSEDLLALLDHLNIERCHLVGVSMGGAIALNFALNYPHRVNRLVLISPGIVAWEWSDQWSEWWRPILKQAEAGDLSAARELWFQHPLFAQTRESPAAGELKASIMRYSGKQWLQDNQREELPDVDRLHQLQAPTLLLTGKEDVDEFRLMASLIENAVPDIKRLDLAGLGHLPHIEDPEQCVVPMRQFLYHE